MALNFLSLLDLTSSGDNVDEGFLKAQTNFAMLDDMLHGYCRRSKLRWKDADEIYIGSGVYFHEGTTDQMLYWSSELTFQVGSGGTNALSEDLGASEWHYVYIDDSAVVTAGTNLLTATEFVNNTTAPTWSASKQAWYNGSDRCISAFYSSTGSEVTEFYQHEKYVSFAGSVTLQAGTNLAAASSFTDISTAVRAPAFASLASIGFLLFYVDGTGTLLWRPNGSSTTTGHYGGRVTAGGTDSYFITDVIIDSSGIFEWCEGTTTANTASLFAHGWYLPEGM
jgi:hypothetical protein